MGATLIPLFHRAVTLAYHLEYNTAGEKFFGISCWISSYFWVS